MAGMRLLVWERYRTWVANAPFWYRLSVYVICCSAPLGLLARRAA